jgi:hypothetical protein
MPGTGYWMLDKKTKTDSMHAIGIHTRLLEPARARDFEEPSMEL